MIYNSIEEELWRIFTFYALHSDPTQPEVLKPANFIKFCKDCQITSKKFTTSSVELEIARLARMKSQGVDYILSNSINFIDFMQLLEMVSVKIYPRDSPEVAAKRLVLENVLLLAHRRTPLNDYFDLDNVEATNLITETFAGGLQHIFNYYIGKANTRRADAVSLEKMKQKELMRQSGHVETDKEALNLVISPVKQQNLKYLKGLMNSQKDMISYKEYLQFCQDFCLKSTALLTATQLGEIYLSIVPLHSVSSVQQSTHSARHNDASGEGLMVAGMTFQLFCQSIMFMALLAYRNLDPAVPTTYKVKALLLYMLKCVVDGNRTLQFLSKERSHGVSNTKGQLHLFGSTEFAAQFTANWQREGYCDYTAPPVVTSLTGTNMLRKVVGEDTAENNNNTNGTPMRGRTGSAISVDSSFDTVVVAPNTPSNARSPAAHTAGGWGFGNGHNNSNTSHHNTHNSSGLYVLPAPPVVSVTRPDYPVTIDAADLKLLLQKKPEFAEFLFLEIETMKLETERLTHIE
eukprot:gene16071-18352_t